MGLLSSFFASGVGVAPPSYSLAAIYDLVRGGARAASSGALVTRESALTYGPWWRGITMLSADTAKLPFYVYERTMQGKGKVLDTQHPAYYLMLHEPSEYESAFSFVELLTSHALARGNGYAYIETAGDGSPTALLPMDPDRITPVRKDGVVWYVQDIQTPKPIRFPAEKVLHIRGYGDDGLMGYSVIDKVRESLGLAVAQHKYSGTYFRNSGRPAVTLEAPVGVNEKAAIATLEGWERMLSGPDNAHKTALLTHGMKANVISFSADDSQLIESRAFEIRQVALYIGIPPHKIGDTSRTAFSSLEQENLDYLNQSLDPWLTRWEREVRRKLFSTQERLHDTHLGQFDRAELLRADRAAQAAYYSAALGGAPWMKVNEVREAEGLEPDDDGDELMKPLNMGSGALPPAKGPASLPPPKPAPDPQEETASAHLLPPAPAADFAPLRASARKLLASVASSVVRRVNADARKASASVPKYMAWLDSVVGDNATRVAEQLAPALEVASHLGGVGRNAADDLLFRLRDEYAALADSVTPRMLPASAEALSARLEGALPLEFSTSILGDPS